MEGSQTQSGSLPWSLCSSVGGIVDGVLCMLSLFSSVGGIGDGVLCMLSLCSSVGGIIDSVLCMLNQNEHC